MNPRRRSAVSTYLEVFVLIALAVGGSGLVLGAALGPASSVGGGSVSVIGATISQGEAFAFEKLAVQNTGNAPFGWFSVSTAGVPPSASYCYSLYDPLLRATPLSTCPGMSVDPRVVTVAAVLAPGKALVFELTIEGAPFPPGSTVRVTVLTSNGAAEGVDVAAVPA